MHLSKLMLANFKGKSETLELAKLNLIVGANASGKSTILEALQFAIEGRTSLGGRNEDSAKLASSPNGFNIGVTAEDPFFGWSRGIAIDNVKHTASMTCVAGDITKVKQASESITNAVGGFAPMFDLGTFLDLSDDLKRNFVLNLCAKVITDNPFTFGSLTADILNAWLRLRLGVETIRALTKDKNSIGAYLAIREQIGENEHNGILNAIHKVVVNVVDDVDDPATAISETLAAAKELINSSRTAKDEARAAARRFSDRKTEVHVAAEHVSVLKEKRTACEASIKEVEHQLGVQEGKTSARSLLVRTIEQAETSLDTLKPPMLAVPDVDIDAIEKDIGSLETTLPPESANIQDLKLTALTIDKAFRKNEEALSWHGDTITRCDRRIKEIENGDWGRLSGLLGALSCCTCDPPIFEDPPTSELAIAMDEIGSIIDKNFDTETLDQNKIDRKNSASEVEALTTKIPALESQQKVAVQQVQDAEKIANNRSEICRAIGSKKMELATVKGDIELNKTKEANYQQSKALYEKNVVDAQKALDEFDREGGNIPVSDLADRKNGLYTDLATLSETIQTKQKMEVLDQELAECLLRAEQEEAAWSCYKMLADAIKILREDMMDAMIKPLLDRMGKFLKNRPFGRLVNAKGKPVFELGWVTEDDRERLYDSMSGGERVMFSAALAYALVSMSGAPLKLLLCECGELDETNLENLLKAIVTVQDDLSNVILVTHIDIDDSRMDLAAKDWNTIDRNSYVESTV